jgi:hypothetical protein
MTQDEILVLPAGRELDAMVAEQVMGWVREEPRWYNRQGGFESIVDLWQPSVSHNQAFIVVERFSVPKFYVRLCSTVTGRWRCDIDLCGGDGPTRSCSAWTVPLAICRAALLAVAGA